MHGGEAKIESKLGEGTTVRVFLPYAALSATAERIATPPVRLDVQARARNAAA